MDLILPCDFTQPCLLKKYSHPVANLSESHQHPQRESNSVCVGAAYSLDKLTTLPDCHECPPVTGPASADSLSLLLPSRENATVHSLIRGRGVSAPASTTPVASPACAPTGLCCPLGAGQTTCLFDAWQTGWSADRPPDGGPPSLPKPVQFNQSVSPTFGRGTSSPASPASSASSAAPHGFGRCLLPSTACSATCQPGRRSPTPSGHSQTALPTPLEDQTTAAPDSVWWTGSATHMPPGRVVWRPANVGSEGASSSPRRRRPARLFCRVVEPGLLAASETGIRATGAWTPVAEAARGSGGAAVGRLRLSRSYVCTLCSKCFTSNSGLKQHMHIHASFKPFRCQVGWLNVGKLAVFKAQFYIIHIQPISFQKW
ncbi:unnamed protein product [Protopolystoma xenopodis]|uniref:C2H2-type domain-containing protein n=1 Tax=Protopolystoma xenopodis TaxID=117903 RepID=A0A3S5AIN8_9PLAT|nr:unnamed protein product [Protopolystoma xenopodis]